ncbi:hypothetical protein [Streptomyces sp. NPDC051001]|uniref:hypothetical protein n=1 Tax=Streptomyces sp. NPDC051001 TaxID=3155795 RepID=UPI0034199987
MITYSSPAVLVDGAAHQLELIQKEAGRRAVTIHIVLDIVHAIEKLWASARSFHTATDPAADHEPTTAHTFFESAAAVARRYVRGS